MLTKAKKSAVVDKLKDRISRQTVMFFTTFRGTPVAKLNALRRLLKRDGAEYVVAKKTLFDRSLNAAKIPFETQSLAGEVGVAFGYRDQVIPAKTLVRFSKSEETLRIAGAILGSRILASEEVAALSKIPSREVLLAQVGAGFARPLRGLAYALQTHVRNLVAVLENIKSKKSRE